MLSFPSPGVIAHAIWAIALHLDRKPIQTFLPSGNIPGEFSGVPCMSPSELSRVPIDYLWANHASSLSFRPEGKARSGGIRPEGNAPTNPRSDACYSAKSRSGLVPHDFRSPHDPATGTRLESCDRYHPSARLSLGDGWAAAHPIRLWTRESPTRRVSVPAESRPLLRRVDSGLQKDPIPQRSSRHDETRAG